jgi:hypothetical protein
MSISRRTHSGYSANAGLNGWSRSGLNVAGVDVVSTFPALKQERRGEYSSTGLRIYF